MAQPLEHDQSRISELLQEQIHIWLLMTVRVLSDDDRDWATDSAEAVPCINIGTLSKDLCFDFRKTTESPAVAGLSKSVVEVQVKHPRVP